MTKRIYASSVAAIISIIFVVVITIWADLFPPLKAWLKSVSGHHWTTKSWFSMGVYFFSFLFVTALPGEIGDRKARMALYFLSVAAILGSLALLLFYALHFFGKI